MQKITPFLWFNNNAGEAIDHYTSIFKNSKTINVRRYGKTGPMPEGTVMTGTIELEGQQFMLLNAGPMFSFTPAISLFVNCETQEEVDYYWEQLIADGGKESQCGWLKDQFGVSWQIVPKALSQCLGGDDKEGSARALQAMLQMQKIIVEDLENAYAGK